MFFADLRRPFDVVEALVKTLAILARICGV